MTQTAELQAALTEHEELLARSVRTENRILREALELWDNYVDPLDAFRDGGELWEPLSAGGNAQRQAFRSEQELAAARSACRALALTNEFAINGHENRISYIVGSGHRYQIVARKHADPPREFLVQAQAVLDEFLRDNKWHQRQQEIVRRRDRDGEAFLRFFLDAEGKTRVRFVESWQVTESGERRDESGEPERSRRRLALGSPHSPLSSFGIQTDPDDVETVLGYWLDDGEFVDAEEIQHRKANVDANVLRGVPLFYPVRKNLARAEKLLRNMAAVSDIQTAIALIRKHRSGKQSSLEQLRSGLASATVTSKATGKTTYFQPFQPGTILDVYSDAEYDFPARGLDASRYVLVLQAILRAVASRLVMPEFMLTSDASNANYSSTLVAEGPAVKMFERLQHDMIVDDLDVLWRVLRAAVDSGRLAAEDLRLIDIEVEPPKLAVRDRLQEAQVDQILVRNGAMSVQRMALRHGLDPEQERRLREEAARNDGGGAVAAPQPKG
jgi:capsid protein